MRIIVTYIVPCQNVHNSCMAQVSAYNTKPYHIKCVLTLNIYKGSCLPPLLLRYGSLECATQCSIPIA